MKLLWLTWKDREHPQAGGAEFLNEELALRLARDGHEVLIVTSAFPGASPREERNGYTVLRLGNRYSVYWKAYRYYKTHLRGWADLVIDEMNTVPFFAKYYVNEPNLLLVYQLCREIWFYQMSQPFSTLGYIAEPLYLRLLNDRGVITESESTRLDLARFGFDRDNVHIISVGVNTTPLSDLDTVVKRPVPTLLSLGAMRDMKRTIDQIEAFELAKRQLPSLQLKVVGTPVGVYGTKVLERIAHSSYAHDIEYLGSISHAEKTELMRTCHLILVTSVKEGWGLIVTEANSQGTPAVVYSTDGLRDSVRHGETGIVCGENTPQTLANSVVSLLNDADQYARLRQNAWRWSCELTLDRSYQDFIRALAI